MDERCPAAAPEHGARNRTKDRHSAPNRPSEGIERPQPRTSALAVQA